MRATKKRWRPAPFLVVSATALSVVAFMVCSSWLSARRNRINARVEIAAPLVETATRSGEPAQIARSRRDDDGTAGCRDRVLG